MSLKPFKKIGIGVTFSPYLKANIYEASRLALMLQSDLVLIHVGEKTSDKEAQFHSILEPFLKKDLKFEIIFQPGNPVDVILSTTLEKEVDLLILGALKRENFLKYYVGSIARKITRKAQCSVLLLIKPSVERIPCQHIVVNGLEDPKTKQAIDTAFYVAHHLKSELITIVEEIKQDEIAVKVDDDRSLRKVNIAKKRIRLRETNRVKKIIDDIPDLYKKGIKIKSQPIFGKRGYSIGHYAQVVRADLLVINSPNRLSFLDRLFPHDIEHILTELPTDVLILQ